MRALLAWLLALLLATGCGSRPGGVGVDDAGTAGEVSVQVVFGDRPAAGAIVQLLDANQSPLGEVRADEDGMATFKNVPAGRGYQAIANLEGMTGTAANLVVSSSKNLTKLVLSASGGPVGIVVGSVKASGADTPLANVVVEINGKKASTDANGQFKLEGVPAGPATIRASLGGHGTVSEAVVVKGGSSSAVALVLQPLASGPKAGRTLIASPGQVIELDAWYNRVGSFPASQAWSAVFTPGGGILVADAGADKVVEYSDSGAKRSTYTARAIWQLGFGGIKNPKGASRTPSGNIVVADTGHDRVVEIDSSNKVVWEFKTGLLAPRWAERLPRGNTLIVDTGHNRVIEIDNSGRIVWGVGDGSTDVLNQPATAQRLPNGNTLVCDSGNSRVMEVNNRNQLVWMVPGRGDAGALANPNSARRLATGNTLIADTDNNRVIEVSPEGGVVWKAPVQQPLFADRF